MVEQEWMKFVSTGHIQDYLNYKSQSETEKTHGDATISMMAEREHTSGSVKEYGTDHNLDGHGVICSPSGRI